MLKKANIQWSGSAKPDKVQSRVQVLDSLIGDRN